MASASRSTEGDADFASPGATAVYERVSAGRARHQNWTLITLLRRPSSCRRNSENYVVSWSGTRPLPRLQTYLVTLVLAAVLPLAVFSVGVTWWASRLELSAQRVELQRLAATTAAAVAVDLARATVLTETLARSPLLAAGDIDRFELFMRSVAATTGVTLVLGSRTGEYVINTASPPGASPRNIPRPDLVRQVTMTGRPFLTNILAGPYMVRPMAGLIVPVPDGGPQAAVVAARINSAELLALLPRPGLWRGAFAVVYDGAGHPFVSNAAAGVSVPPFPANLEDSDVRPEWTAASEAGFTAAVEPIAASTWHVALLAPRASLAATWSTALATLIGVGFVVIVVAAMLALLLGRFLVREAGRLVSEATAPDVGSPATGGRSRVHEIDVLRRALRSAAIAARERVFEQARLASLANTATELEARVVERTRALEEATGRLLNAQDDERRRIARDLHDSTVQELVAASLHLMAAQRAMTGAAIDERGARALNEALMGLDRAKEELRTVSFLMQPPLLDECGLATALRSYAEGFSRRSGLAVTVEAPEADPVLPRAMETALFRVVQEALTNVHRHANSPTALVRLQITQGGVVLEIEDAGVGMAKGGPVSPGVGIAGMRARVRQLGGDLSIETGSGATRVRATLPLSFALPSVTAA